MKKTSILLLICLMANALSAQSKKVKEIREKFWGANDQYKNVVDIPDKWKNESAVIIYQEYSYLYKGTKKTVDYRESIRKRIKLLDKSAVDAYSEFSFAENFKVERGFAGKGGRVFAGVKIIKSNGEETEISMDDAVDVGGTLKKLAVPDLEIGDIIDYYYYIYEPFVTINAYVFDPIVATLSAGYPIMKQRLEFEVGKKFFINFNSLHGAPKLKVEDQSSRKSVLYSMEGEDIEKEDDLRWFYARRVLPIIKFQVVYARKSRLEKQVAVFLGEKKTVKSNVTKREVFEYYKDYPTFDEKNVGLKKYLKNNGFSKKSNEEIIREAYYYLRFHNLIYKIEPIVWLQNDIISGLPYYYGNFLSDRAFVQSMGSFLQSQKIPFEVVVAIPRYLSTLDELLLEDEITLLIRTTGENPIYLSRFRVHTNFNHLPSELEGTRAYVLRNKGKKKIQSIAELDLPISTKDQNKTISNVKVSFASEDFNTLDVDREVEHHGYNKEDEQSDLINLQDYVEKEQKYYGQESYLYSDDIRKKERKKIIPKIEAKNEKDLEEQKERFKKNASGEMATTIEEFKAYNIKSQGRFGEETVFSYEDQFQMEGFTKRAGKNYIFEAGKLIGGQVALKEEEMERTQDIYMPYARSFENNITVAIPEGYTVDGLDKLNKSVKNATGGFISTASVEGNQLKITTNKYYNNNFEKAANWPLMIEFLEAAFQFTQEKVLLKKG